MDVDKEDENEDVNESTKKRKRDSKANAYKARWCKIRLSV